MRNFAFERATTDAAALEVALRTANTVFLGGGTNLVDLMRRNIVQPDVLVDITDVKSGGITEQADGNLVIGASTTNSTIASDRLVRERYPVLAQAILAGASGQIRNMATAAGNLMQRTRCIYFYDVATRCNQRELESGCDALQGLNRMHAILGASPACVATHPSDMCVALSALDAIVHVVGSQGPRAIPLNEFYIPPGVTPNRQTKILPHELIKAIEIPASPAARRSGYHKVRDRASFAFALVSVAAVLEVKDDRVATVRIALGGVAHKPWRAYVAERFLVGQAPSVQSFRQAAEAELAQAQALADNGFKIELASRMITGLLEELMGKIQ